ncbi:MAG: hypothetical protein KOO63_12955, partial [Bacteroidales bacterium]|nr:hypothetical protein [Candidatus Latescibacterota bacterium]
PLADVCMAPKTPWYNAVTGSLRGFILRFIFFREPEDFAEGFMKTSNSQGGTDHGDNSNFHLSINSAEKFLFERI